MGPSPNHRQDQTAVASPADSQQGTDISRRLLLKGSVATTAVASALPLANSAYADAPDPKSPEHMMAFLVLSSALTGVRIPALAPEFVPAAGKPMMEQTPTIDPFNVKNDYFKWIVAADSASFTKLLKIAEDHQTSAADIITEVSKSEDTLFLARSIVLLWYFGVWYKPEELKGFATPPGVAHLVPFEVVSAKSYTQGVLWQIIQAHPMGYSNLQFGYWSRDPNDPNDPTDRSNLGLITSTIP